MSVEVVSGIYFEELSFDFCLVNYLLNYGWVI